MSCGENCNCKFDYIAEAMKTNYVNVEEMLARLSDKRYLILLHAVMGLSTEANELLDAVKKYIFYGKEIDKVNLIEEAGDIFWYMAALCKEFLNIDFKEVQFKNIEKLRARYGETWHRDGAINRDLEKERSILESKIKIKNT